MRWQSRSASTLNPKPSPSCRAWHSSGTGQTTTQSLAEKKSCAVQVWDFWSNSKVAVSQADAGAGKEACGFRISKRAGVRWLFRHCLR